VTICAGSGGIGKSVVLLNIISNTTTGNEFDCCGTKVTLPKGSVILMSAEGKDSIAVTPKLIAMGADLSKVHTIICSEGVVSKKRRLLQLDTDLRIIEDKIIELSETDSPIRLMIIDPITYFTGKVKDHIQREVCDFIHELNHLAEKYSFALIFNKHRRKQSGNQTLASLADEVGGTAAWVNTPRQAIGFVKHPLDNNKFLMASIKSNVNPEENKSYCYSINPVSIIHNGISIKTIKVTWASSMEEINLGDASNKEIFAKTKSEQCDELIYTYLKENGDTSMIKIIELCDLRGVDRRLRQRVVAKMKANQEIEDAPGNLKPHIRLKKGFCE